MVAANSLAGVAEITVAGVDIDNVVIVLQPAPHVTGRVAVRRRDRRRPAT